MPARRSPLAAYLRYSHCRPSPNLARPSPLRPASFSITAACLLTITAACLPARRTRPHPLKSRLKSSLNPLLNLSLPNTRQSPTNKISDARPPPIPQIPPSSNPPSIPAHSQFPHTPTKSSPIPSPTNPPPPVSLPVQPSPPPESAKERPSVKPSKQRTDAIVVT